MSSYEALASLYLLCCFFVGPVRRETIVPRLCATWRLPACRRRTARGPCPSLRTACICACWLCRWRRRWRRRQETGGGREAMVMTRGGKERVGRSGGGSQRRVSRRGVANARARSLAYRGSQGRLAGRQAGVGWCGADLLIDGARTSPCVRAGAAASALAWPTTGMTYRCVQHRHTRRASLVCV